MSSSSILTSSFATNVVIQGAAQQIEEGAKISWNTIPIQGITNLKQRKLAIRLNSFGSLYYFMKVVLGKWRLKDYLHADWCALVETHHLKHVIEIPRDHFKSTIFSESTPIWWALPFGDEDAYAMEKLGYPPEYIRWMRYAHNPDTRTLLASQVIVNAIKLGKRIDYHYKSNDIFREVFKEVLPDSSCTWAAQTMMHKRTKASPDGEGTYDFVGVGTALQSRHYDRMVEDDLFGRDAAISDNPDVYNNIIDYHRLLPGAFDSNPILQGRENDEIVVGNRWRLNDLNQWIRTNEPWFKFVTHSATGGCCPQHPAGSPIFPDEWSIEKLEHVKIREGIYHYSCQYENNPIPEGAVEFNVDWLNYYEFAPVTLTDKRIKFVHEVKNGNVLTDLMPADLQIELIMDPRHSDNEKQSGRSRHGIVVVGYLANPQRMYLIDCWAGYCGYEKAVDKLYEFIFKYKLKRIWLETLCAQKLLKLYLDYKNRITGLDIRVEELKRDYSPNAKLERIRAYNVFFASGQFYLRRSGEGMSDFFTEYSTFPYGITMDILDTLAYSSQTFIVRASKKEVAAFMQAHRARIEQNMATAIG